MVRAVDSRAVNLWSILANKTRIICLHVHIYRGLFPRGSELAGAPWYSFSNRSHLWWFLSEKTKIITSSLLASNAPSAPSNSFDFYHHITLGSVICVYIPCVQAIFHSRLTGSNPMNTHKWRISHQNSSTAPESIPTVHTGTLSRYTALHNVKSTFLVETLIRLNTRDNITRVYVRQLLPTAASILQIHSHSKATWNPAQRNPKKSYKKTSVHTVNGQTMKAINKRSTKHN